MSSPMPIVVFGKKYPSLTAAARAFDRPANTFRKYMMNGIEPEAHLSCSHALLCLDFIAPDGRAYYSIPFVFGHFTTREIVEHYRPDLLAAYDATNPTGKYKPFRRHTEN